METQPVAHPTAEVLKAFGLGKLDDNSTGELMAHLDHCAECRQAAAALSGDDFLNRLRQAHSRNSTPAPAKALTGIEGRPRPAPPGNVPPELADNPQYEIVRELGRGGMGVVYLAKNKLMDRLEVLKVINKALLDHPGALERFLREIRSAAKLNHVNVVAAYSALQWGGLLAFAMEYVEGQDLAAVVKAQGPLPVPHSCFYIQQAAQGLQHAFEKNMVHRDIKPQNLILAREGRKHLVKVLDFGLAKVIQEKSDDTGLTGEGKMIGTPDYMAPEQTLDAASADIRADIYSLGCTLYFLLSGSRPFQGKSLYEIMQAHQTREAAALNLVRPEVPVELAEVVRKMMAKDRSLRYQTPLEVMQALKPFVKQTAQKPSPQSSSRLPVAAPAAPIAKPMTLVREGPPSWDALSPSDIASAGSPTHHPRGRKKWLIGGSIAGSVLLLALLSLLASGIFKIKTKHGTIVLENVPANAVVEVDGETVTLDAGDGKPLVIGVTAGRKHRLQVRKEGFKVFGKEVEIDAGGRLPIVVRLERAARPIKPAPAAEGAAEKKDFVSLFNGKDLKGWSVEYDDAKAWGVEDGVIVARGTNRQQLGYLLSDREYGDFILRLEFKLEDHTASGVVLRAVPGELLPHPYGGRLREHPVFMLEDHPERAEVTGTMHWVLDSTHVKPHRPAELLPTGSWNKMEIEMKGRSLHATVNGKLVCNDTLAEGAVFKDKTIPALNRPKGRIGLLKSYRRASFRNIEIKELNPRAAGAADSTPKR